MSGATEVHRTVEGASQETRMADRCFLRSLTYAVRGEFAEAIILMGAVRAMLAVVKMDDEKDGAFVDAFWSAFDNA